MGVKLGANELHARLPVRNRASGQLAEGGWLDLLPPPAGVGVGGNLGADELHARLPVGKRASGQLAAAGGDWDFGFGVN